MTGVATVERKPSKVSALKAELVKYEESFEKLLPKGYEPSRLVTGALIAATTNPAILDCTPRSVALALAKVAQWGLDVGTTAHLVPYGKDCKAIIDYKGYIELMLASDVRKVSCQVVREGEVFEYQMGTEEFIRHHPNHDVSKPITGAYCVLTLKHNYLQFEVMTAEEIDAIRQEHSKQWKKGPLTEWYARKTVIRRVAKYVKKNPRLADALAADDGERLEGLEIPEGQASPLPEGMDPETGEVLPPGTTTDDDDLPL